MDIDYRCLPGEGSAKPRVMTPQSSVNFPKIDLKSPFKVQKQYKKWVMRAGFALLWDRCLVINGPTKNRGELAG